MFEINQHLQLEFKNLIIDNIIEKLNSDLNTAVIIADGPKIGKALELINEFFPLSITSIDSIIKEIYLLYVFSYLLRTSSYHIHLTESEFLEKIYYPTLIYVLAYFLKKCSKFFQNCIRKIYKESKEKLEKPLMFYITFYNSEYIVIKNDIINIFLNNMLFDINPLDLNTNYKEYYTSVFQYIFYLYLQRQSSGLIEEDIDLFSDQDDITLSSRYNIYKNGIRRTQIQLMCNESATLKKIYSNFNKVKNDIISNELQKLYTIIVDKNSLIDNKMLVLKFNMEDENLLIISQQYPLIYKLLRSIKIKSGEPKYNNYDKLLIKETLKNSIYAKLYKFLNEEHALLLADTMSIKIEQSITEGSFLDPYTLTILEVRGSMFLQQLSAFINMILDHIDTVENPNSLLFEN